MEFIMKNTQFIKLILHNNINIDNNIEFIFFGIFTEKSNIMNVHNVSNEIIQQKIEKKIIIVMSLIAFSETFLKIGNYYFVYTVNNCTFAYLESITVNSNRITPCFVCS